MNTLIKVDHNLYSPNDIEMTINDEEEGEPPLVCPNTSLIRKKGISGIPIPKISSTKYMKYQKLEVELEMEEEIATLGRRKFRNETDRLWATVRIRQITSQQADNISPSNQQYSSDFRSSQWSESSTENPREITRHERRMKTATGVLKLDELKSRKFEYIMGNTVPSSAFFSSLQTGSESPIIKKGKDDCNIDYNSNYSENSSGRRRSSGRSSTILNKLFRPMKK